MAPKKGKDKDKAPPVPEVQSLYQKRDPLPPPESPNVEEIEDAWKATREAYLCPLPDFDAEQVNTTEWNPNEVTTLYSNESFSSKLLPRPFNQCVTTWKRASSVSDNTAQEEAPPEAKPPAPPPEPVVEPVAKGKAKPAPAKGKEPVPSAKPGTMAQFAEVQYAGDAVVVSAHEFRTRLFDLTNDDGIPPLSQAIAAQISIVGEHARLMPKGSFLWELIYPQNEDGLPLYNPNGKYIVKLFVQGRWREVLVDDVVPVGSATGSAALHAPILPAAASPNSIWAQILSKALLRAFNHDLRAPIIPAIQALTGFSLYQMPLSWQGLRNIYETRLFCCLQLSSKVDMEARQREALMAASAEVDRKQQKDRKGGAPGAPAVPALNLSGGGAFASQAPKLGTTPVESLLQFLVCELEDEPPQARLKAAMWRPMGGTPRKVVLDVAESEGPDEEEDLPRAEQEDRASDAEDHDDDEDEDRRSQRSPSGENTVPSARSKEDAGGVEDYGATESPENEEERPLVIPWPTSTPSSLNMKSLMKNYHEQLQGGYWVGLDILQDSDASFITFLAPNSRALTAVCDTTWVKRSDPYVPGTLRLLKLQLTSEEFDVEIEPTPRSPEDDFGEPEPRERTKPWFKTTLCYEPLRLDPLSTTGAPPLGPGATVFSCLLQRVNRWSGQDTNYKGPECINLAVTENGGSSANRSVLLPPGEHWYLVSDDALKAGSVLSVVVDGATISRNKSSAEFVDPTEFLPERGISMAMVGASEYPPQRGFSVWAKAEIHIKSLATCDSIQLLSFLSDPSLRAHVRLTLLRYEEESCDDPAERCAMWSCGILTRVPLLPLMSLTLGKQPEVQAGSSVKYIIMLEANVPSLTKGGTFSLHLVTPPARGSMASAPMEAGGDESEQELRLVDLKVDHVMRWNGEVVPNQKGIVLRERIVVPHGHGDVTGTICITAQGLPRAVLSAVLMAQLPPNQQMRPKVEGATPEPFAAGAPIDPKEYSGRQNWLDSKMTVAKESGMERVMFSHVMLCEGSTYLLDVFVDPYKGPDKLEGGTWLVEVFGSGEVEMGADTMEQDLEALVRRSWEDPSAEALEPRKNRAARSRKKWLRKRGLLTGTPDELDDEPPPPPEPKAEAKAKAKGGKEEQKRSSKAEAKGAAQQPEEPEINKEEQEAGWLAEALKRAAGETHSNATVDEFVNVHTEVEPTLTEEDPYTIAPVLDDTILDDEKLDGVAVRGLGMRGTAAVRQAEMESSMAKWEEIQSQAAAAKEKNAQALLDLSQWSETHASIDAKFPELREPMRNSFQQRYQSKLALKDVVMNPEKLDPVDLQAALDEAERQDVAIWDEELIATGGQKKSFIEAFESLKERLSKLEAEPLADEESREALSKLSTSVGQLQKELIKKQVPFPPEMLEKDLLEQASEAIAAALNQGTEEATS